MKNGIYLFLILFLGVLGYFVVNDLYNENSVTLASVVFLFVSTVIVVLSTHFKKKSELVTAQKVIGVLYISLFALYGISVGVNLLNSSSVEIAVFRAEGFMFLAGALVLFYGVFVFMKRHSRNGHFL